MDKNELGALAARIARYVIEGGLLPGDRLVTVGVQNLHDGARVVIEDVVPVPGGSEEAAP